jgi:hypothetical protein
MWSDWRRGATPDNSDERRAVIDHATFLDYLDSVHARTRRVVACITPDALEWTPAPGRWSAGDQVRHLAAIERWMYAETVSGRPSRYAGHDRELADGLASVMAYYDAMHVEVSMATENATHPGK